MKFPKGNYISDRFETSEDSRIWFSAYYYYLSLFVSVGLINSQEKKTCVNCNLTLITQNWNRNCERKVVKRAQLEYYNVKKNCKIINLVTNPGFCQRNPLTSVHSQLPIWPKRFIMKLELSQITENIFNFETFQY